MTVGVLAVAALAGCSSPTQPTPTGQSAPPTVQAAPESKPPFTLPDYKGKTLNVAYDELDKAGVLHAAVDKDNNKAVLSPKNWTIDSYEPGPGATVKAGEKVTFQVFKPAEVVPAKEATSAGLEWAYAQVACNAEGKDQYRFGFKAHEILGDNTKNLVNDKWFLRFDATITNQYNAEAKVAVECVVSGSNQAPVIESFDIY